MTRTGVLLSEDEAGDLAAKILVARLGSEEFQGVKVRSGLDEDGELSLFVTARVRTFSEETGGIALGEVTTALRRALEAQGDGRFPYLRFDYGGEAPFDEAEAYPAGS